MVEFLTRKKTASEVEDIIRNAERELVLISPYLQLSDDLVARLKEKRSIKIELVYADEERNPDQEKKVQEQLSKLQSLKNLSISRLKHLHAKCYYNEDCLIITSTNLYDYSERNNWEMGLLIRRKENEDVFDKTRAEAESIIHASENVKPRESLVNKAIKLGRFVGDLLTEPKGYCIKCGKEMTSYDENHPICSDCWKAGARQGYFCYECGKRQNKSVTQNRPLCDSCYENAYR